MTCAAAGLGSVSHMSATGFPILAGGREAEEDCLSHQEAEHGGGCESALKRDPDRNPLKPLI